MNKALLLLKEKRIRPTLARLQILTLLCEAEDERVSVETIYRKMLEDDTSTSLSTVYRVLNKMALDGLLERVWGGDANDSRLFYRICSDDLSASEHEVLCSHCQRHLRVTLPGLREELNRLCAEKGLQPQSRPVIINVVCEACTRPD
jgi:Fe2+ or Zn2+ uptake regulation protein